MPSSSAATRRLVGAAVAGDEDVLVERVVEIAQRRRADRVQRADDASRRRAPSPAPAGRPSPARRRPSASPCRRSPPPAGPSRRRRSARGAARRAGCAASRPGCETGRRGSRAPTRRPRRRSARTSNLPAGTAARARTTVSPARWGSREPRTTSPPARASRTARPKPRAPEAPMMETGSGKRCRAYPQTPTRGGRRPVSGPGTRGGRRSANARTPSRKSSLVAHSSWAVTSCSSVSASAGQRRRVDDALREADRQRRAGQQLADEQVGRGVELVERARRGWRARSARPRCRRRTSST